MNFALSPDDAPPRIIRFCDLSHTPNLVAELHRDTNVLLVDRRLFDLLPPDQRDRVLKTHQTRLFVKAASEAA